MLENLTLFNSLRNRGYRLLWGGLSFSFLGESVYTVLVSWLTLDLTGSSLLLGVIMALNFTPQMLGIFSGVVADRMSKRKLMMTVDMARVVFSFAMGSLIIGGNIQFWQIALIVLAKSTLSTLNMPAQSAYTIELVGKDNITNAISLNRLSQFVMGIIGPSLVGAFVNTSGIGPFFYFNAVCMGLTVILVAMTKEPKTDEAIRLSIPRQRSISRDIVEGLKFSWHNKPIFASQMIYFVTNIYMWPCIWTLNPIFTKEVLKLDASGLGWLTAANRIGGFVTNLVLASKEPKGKGRLVFITSLLWGIVWLPFSAIVWMPVSVISQLIMGFVSSFTMTLASVILLIHADPSMRGRIMGIETLCISSQGPGSLLAGALAQSVGVVTAINIESIFFILTMIGLAKLVPALYKA